MGRNGLACEEAILHQLPNAAQPGASLNPWYRDRSRSRRLVRALPRGRWRVPAEM